MWLRPYYQTETEEGRQKWQERLTYFDRPPPDARYWQEVMGDD